LQAVLWDSAGKFVKYGTDARDMFLGAHPDLQKSFKYFQQPKMELYVTDAAKATEVPMLTASDGEKVPAVKVIASILRHLATTGLEQINSGAVRAKLSFLHVLFVVTVPAIWSEGSKKLMRAAAVQAGICNANESNLLLSLESEAASLACFEEAKTAPDFRWGTGTRYLVMDLGGGTADFSVHEVTESKAVGEVVASRGGGWGSTYIDKALMNFVDRLIVMPETEEQGAQGVLQKKTLSFMAEYQREQPQDYVELLGNFERRKCMLSLKEEILTRIQGIPLPTSRSFTQYVLAKTKKTLKEHISNFFRSVEGQKLIMNMNTSPVVSNKDKETVASKDKETVAEKEKEPVAAAGVAAIPAAGVAAIPAAGAAIAAAPAESPNGKEDVKQDLFQFNEERNRFAMAKRFMLSFFDPLVSKTIQCANEMIKEAKGVSYIFLVGGFGTSDIMRKAVENLASQHAIQVVVPNHCELSVLKGAVIFGTNPKLVFSRVVQWSYGFICYMLKGSKAAVFPYNVDVPWKWMRGDYESAHYAPVFVPLCKAGETIKTGHRVEDTVTPMRYDCNAVNVYLMRTRSKRPHIFDGDADLELCATVLAQSPMRGGCRREIEIQCDFGGTEIVIECVDKHSRLRTRAAMEFAKLM
jgi:hypothetical protein